MRRLLLAAILAVGASAVAHETDQDNLPPDQAKPSAKQVQFAEDLPSTVIIRINKKNHNDISVAHLKDHVVKGQPLPAGVKFEKISLNTETTGISYGVVDELDHGSSTSAWRFGVGGGSRGGFVARGPNGGTVAGGFSRGGFAGGAGGGGWGSALGGLGGGWGGGDGGGWAGGGGGWNNGGWNNGGWNGGGGGWAGGGGWNGGGWNNGGWNGGGWGGGSCIGGGDCGGGGGGWWGGSGCGGGWGGGCSGGCGRGNCGAFATLVPQFIFAGFSYVYRPYWNFADSGYNYGCYGWM